jgi:hypothetical protein
MDVTYRIQRQQPASIAETEVIQYWLRKEVEEDEDDNLDIEALEDREELLNELIDRKPLAESIFVDQDCEWYDLTLAENELRGLEVVKGPSNEGWRAVAKGGLIESTAERIFAADDLEQFSQNVPKDLQKVADFADSVSSDDELDELIVVSEEDDRPYIADGNHRAIGMALHILETDEYIEQDVYIGVDKDRLNATDTTV